MNSYISCELIEAEPMNRDAYNQLRGWNVPVNENATDEGYLIKHDNGQINWMPKTIFEKYHFKLLSNREELLESLEILDLQDLENFKGNHFVCKNSPFNEKIGHILGGTFEVSDECSGFEEWKELCMNQEYEARLILRALLEFSLYGFYYKRGNLDG